MAPATMKAIITTAPGKVELTEIPVPKPQPTEILVKVVAIAQNPTDWKTAEFNTLSHHNILGCDFAGIVEEIGSEVPEGIRKIGEHVAGFVHGGIQKDRGSYAEYLVTDAHFVISLPESLSFENAAGLGIAGFTACQMLYQVQNLATPYNPTTTHEPVLVWSGASGVGQYVVQLAKLSGYTVITTASEKNHAYLKSIGADAVFDYKDPEVVQKIRTYTQGKLKVALDCISENDTPQKIADSLSPEGGKVSAILPYETVRPEVVVELSIAYSLLGKELFYPGKVPARPDHYELGKQYAQLLSKILHEGKLKTTPLKIFPNGLASVAEGLQIHKEGKVSAEKITYIVADTPAPSLAT